MFGGGGPSNRGSRLGFDARYLASMLDPNSVITKDVKKDVKNVPTAPKSDGRH